MQVGNFLNALFVQNNAKYSFELHSEGMEIVQNRESYIFYCNPIDKYSKKRYI